jgi:hypothetical protein
MLDRPKGNADELTFSVVWMSIISASPAGSGLVGADEQLSADSQGPRLE